MVELREIAHQASTILRDNYDGMKYSPLFTLCGVCYHWDSASDGFSDKPVESGLNRIITTIFQDARKQGERIIKSKLYIPRPRDVAAHYCLLSMRNPGVVRDGFASMIEESDRDVLDIVDDTRLLNDAILTYIRLREKKAIPENVDFFDFLLNYKDGEEYMEQQNPSGQFSNLLERLVIRFETSEDIFSELGQCSEGGVFDRLRIIHGEAVETKRPKVSKELLSAHKKYDVGRGAPRIKIENDVLSPRFVFGKRRVKVGTSSNGSYMDLEEYAERMRHRGRVNFDPNKVMEQQLVNIILSASLEDYQTDALGTINGLKARAENSDNAEEAKALKGVIDLLVYVGSFDSSGTIRHEMIITKKA